jgi:hypothetical protein
MSEESTTQESAQFDPNALDESTKTSRRKAASRPESHSEEVIKSLELHGDQARTAEREIAPGLTITLGIRAIHFNADGEVIVVARKFE